MSASPASDLVHGNPASSVAICTLSGHTLQAQLAQSPLKDEVALIGGLQTENTGIERMLITLLETPAIRWLVLCGQQNPRRKQGDVLRALFAAGISPDGQIQGFRGRKLPTLQPEHVEAVREQVGIEDLIGIEDIERIAEAARRCAALPTTGLGRRPALPATPIKPIQIERRSFKIKTLDPNGYFVIQVDRNASQITLDHHGNDHELRHRLVGPDAESLVVAILEWQLVSRLEHTAYLGLELARAEHALHFDLPYRQDAGISPA